MESVPLEEQKLLSYTKYGPKFFINLAPRAFLNREGGEREEMPWERGLNINDSTEIVHEIMISWIVTM